MRKLAVIIIVLGIALLVVSFYPAYAEKPELNAEGPHGIRIDAAYAVPEYHSPLLWWKTNHMDIVNEGDFTEQDCLYCHDPATSCNNCHTYVGVKTIEQ